mmetsp:Transcript_36344/g.96820  ORF Transcript_36344/g.96820 Transcript_36344/m.96820 type:complete len:270 (+) Transcript_36344:426-1235(+)
MLHLKSNLHEADLRVLDLRLVEGTDELVIVHLAGTPVHHGEQIQNVGLAEVHAVQNLLHDGVLVPLHELILADGAAAVRVDVLHDMVPKQKLILFRFFLLDQLFGLTAFPGLCSFVDDARQYEVHEADVHGDQGEREEDERRRLVVNDGDGACTPRIPCNQGLEEEQGGIQDGGKGQQAPVSFSVRELLVLGLDELHGQDGPDDEQEEDQQEADEHRLHGTSEAVNHHVQGRELAYNLRHAHDAEHPEHLEHAELLELFAVFEDDAHEP